VPQRTSVDIPPIEIDRRTGRIFSCTGGVGDVYVDVEGEAEDIRGCNRRCDSQAAHIFRI